MSEQMHSLPDRTMEIPISELEEAQKEIQIRSRKRTKLKFTIGGTLLIVISGAILFQVIQAQRGDAGQTDRDGDVRNNRTSGSRNDQTLARVNGSLIRWQDVAIECMQRHGLEVLDNIINRTIIQQSCESNGITVTRAEIDQEVIRIAKRFNLDPQNWYSVMRDERGLSPVQYRRDIVWPMLAMKKIAGKKIHKPTQDEMDKAFIREYGVRVEAKMIMLDNLRRARSVHEMVVKRPQDFSRIAQKWSIEPTSRAMGGSIPPIRKFGGNKTIEDASFNLRKGEVSPIITLGPRYIILLCEGRTTPVVTEISEVWDELYDMVNERKIQAGVAKVFEGLKENARVDNMLKNVSYGIRKVSGNRSKTGNRVSQAGGTKQQNKASYPQSPSRRKK